jgi:hypothetical protein
VSGVGGIESLDEYWKGLEEVSEMAGDIDGV